MLVIGLFSIELLKHPQEDLKWRAVGRVTVSLFFLPMTEL